MQSLPLSLSLFPEWQPEISSTKQQHQHHQQRQWKEWTPLSLSMIAPSLALTQMGSSGEAGLLSLSLSAVPKVVVAEKCV